MAEAPRQRRLRSRSRGNVQLSRSRPASNRVHPRSPALAGCLHTLFAKRLIHRPTTRHVLNTRLQPMVLWMTSATTMTSGLLLAVQLLRMGYHRANGRGARRKPVEDLPRTAAEAVVWSMAMMREHSAAAVPASSQRTTPTQSLMTTRKQRPTARGQLQEEAAPTTTKAAK